jgi:hypothetical protein
MARAQTFDQLQANIKNITHGTPVDTPAFCDAARTFGHAYIAELYRLGTIGGTWAAMRNQMTLTDATIPTRQASWEKETCPGSGGFMPQSIPTACPHCHQVPAIGSSFRPTHKRNARLGA